MILHSFLGISGSSASPSASCKSLHSAEMDSCMILQLRTRIDFDDQLSYDSTSVSVIYGSASVGASVNLVTSPLYTSVQRCIKNNSTSDCIRRIFCMRMETPDSSCAFLAPSQSSRSLPHSLPQDPNLL
jgi:hypothetical protein